MSAAPTPSASSPEATSPAAAGSSDSSGLSAMDKIVMDYLRSRGHESAATALGQSSGNDGASTSTTLSAEELLKKMAVFAASGTGENAYKSTTNILQELVASGTSSNIKSLIMNMGDGGAEDALSLDPGDKQEGFRDLEAWVEGSLDMYRVRQVRIEATASTYMLQLRSPNSVLYYCQYSVISTSILYTAVLRMLVGGRAPPYSMSMTSVRSAKVL